MNILAQVKYPGESQLTNYDKLGGSECLLLIEKDVTLKGHIVHTVCIYALD